jgi:hypothetical protein
MERHTLKTSTIFAAVGGRTEVYRSVEEMPAPLRRQLEATTNSLNSATILIADRNGREELVRALRGLPSGVRTRLARPLGVPQAAGDGVPLPAAAPHRLALRFLARNWAEILLPGVIGLLLWLAVTQS